MTEWVDRVKNFKFGACIALSKCPLPIMYDSYANWVHRALSGAEFQCALNGMRVVLNVPDDHSKRVLDHHISRSRHNELIIARVGGLTSEEKKLTDKHFISMVVRPEDDTRVE